MEMRIWIWNPMASTPSPRDSRSTSNKHQQPGSMKVLVVDDERLAREELKRLLAAYPDIEVAGDAANGKAALAAIESLKPDAVFLDIQMPGLNGLDVAA